MFNIPAILKGHLYMETYGKWSVIKWGRYWQNKLNSCALSEWLIFYY